MLNVVLLIVTLPVVISQITKGPKDAIGKSGGSVKFQCFINNVKCSSVDWNKLDSNNLLDLIWRNGTVYDKFDRARYSVQMDAGCTLSITRLTMEDAGRYVCQYIFDGKEDQHSAQLVVYSEESCRSNQTGAKLEKGQSLWMSCSATMSSMMVGGNSELTMSWFDSREKAKKTNVTKGDTAVISSSYTAVSPPCGELSYSCELWFKHKNNPEIDHTVLTVCSTESTNYCETSSIQLKSNKTVYSPGSSVLCEANGYPPPTFKWNRTATGKIFDGALLHIDAEAAVGEIYRCTASNMVNGQMHVVFTVVTVEADTSDGSAVTIIGVVVGVVLCCCALAVVIFVVIRHQKSSRKERQFINMTNNRSEKLASKMADPN